MSDPLTVLQTWGTLLAALVAAGAGARSWRIVGNVEGETRVLKTLLGTIREDISANRSDLRDHSGDIKELTVAVARFRDVPSRMESMRAEAKAGLKVLEVRLEGLRRIIEQLPGGSACRAEERAGDDRDGEK